MSMICVRIVAATLLALAATSAGAATNRVWVSGHGADAAGCGPPTNPCRSLQYAHDNVVVAGGEIDILDPAGYGSVNISKAISIVNDGVGTAGVQATTGGVAVNITAGPTDDVYLKGLNIDGVQQSGGNGVLFNAGASLTMIDCVVRHFHTFGMLIDPTSGHSVVYIYNSFVLSNGNTGVYDTPAGNASVSGVFDHLVVNQNGAGFEILEPATSATISSLTFSNDNLAGNAGFGLKASTTQVNLFVSVSNSVLNNNGSDGLWFVGPAFGHISHSIFNLNTGYGIDNQTIVPGGLTGGGDSEAAGNVSGSINGATQTHQTLF
jgi:hypothetical protein